MRKQMSVNTERRAPAHMITSLGTFSLIAFECTTTDSYTLSFDGYMHIHTQPIHCSIVFPSLLLTPIPHLLPFLRIVQIWSGLADRLERDDVLAGQPFRFTGRTSRCPYLISSSHDCRSSDDGLISLEQIAAIVKSRSITHHQPRGPSQQYCGQRKVRGEVSSHQACSR